MLNKFSVNGFKTLKNSEVEFGRVNIFIGGNGTGKSNILEALGILSSGLKDISDAELQKRGVRLSVPTLFKSAFKNVKLRATLDLAAQFENDVSYRLSLKAGAAAEGLRFFTENIEHGNRRLMGRSQAGIRIQGLSAPKKDIDPTRGLWDRFREAIDVPSAVEEELERMARYAIYAPQTAFLRGTEVESIPIQPMGLQGSGLAQAAQVVLRHYNSLRKTPHLRVLYERVLNQITFPGWTSQFRVVPVDADITPRLVKTGDTSLYFVDRFMTEGRNILSAYDSSEGTLYLLFVSILLLHPRAPKIFALDNIDNALNPAVTKKLLESLITCTCSEEYRDAGIGPDQVFLTSHNPTAIDAFDIFDPQQRIFVVARDQAGATEIKRLKPPARTSRAEWVERSGGRKLSELWIEGKIRGALGEPI